MSEKGRLTVTVVLSETAIEPPVGGEFLSVAGPSVNARAVYEATKRALRDAQRAEKAKA